LWKCRKEDAVGEGKKEAAKKVGLSGNLMRKRNSSLAKVTEKTGARKKTQPTKREGRGGKKAP